MTDHVPSRGRYSAGCRCAGCTAANREYGRKHARLSGYDGVASTDLVDAAPAREHVRRLRDAGMGTRAVADAAGVGRNTVTALLHGRPARGTPPTSRLRPATARALLAVSPVLADHALVDASGTRRRLRALVARGWSMTLLAGRLGMTVHNLAPIITSGDTEARVTYRFTTRVRTLYEDLWDVAPPEQGRWEKIAAAQSRRRAARCGWPPPAGWDDAWIDLPDAELEVRLSSLAAGMEDAEVYRCYRAKLAGDLSPLVVAGAGEYLVRVREQSRVRRSRKAA